LLTKIHFFIFIKQWINLPKRPNFFDKNMRDLTYSGSLQETAKSSQSLRCSRPKFTFVTRAYASSRAQLALLGWSILKCFINWCDAIFWIQMRFHVLKNSLQSSVIIIWFFSALFFLLIGSF
jgi:hypothetical protein